MINLLGGLEPDVLGAETHRSSDARRVGVPGVRSEPRQFLVIPGPSETKPETFSGKAYPPEPRIGCRNHCPGIKSALTPPGVPRGGRRPEPAPSGDVPSPCARDRRPGANATSTGEGLF